MQMQNIGKKCQIESLIPAESLRYQVYPFNLRKVNERKPLGLDQNASAYAVHENERASLIQFNQLDPIQWIVKKTFFFCNIKYLDLVALNLAKRSNFLIAGKWNVVQVMFDGAVEFSEREKTFIKNVFPEFNGSMKFHGERLVISDGAFLYVTPSNYGGIFVPIKDKKYFGIQCLEPQCKCYIVLIWLSSKLCVHYGGHETSKTIHNHSTDAFPR